MLHTYSKKRAVSPCVTLEHARAVYDCVLSVQYACTSFKLNIECKLTTDVKDFLTVWSWWLTTSFCQRWLESMQLADPWRALYRWRIWKHFYVTLWRLHKLQTTTPTQKRLENETVQLVMIVIAQLWTTNNIGVAADVVNAYYVVRVCTGVTPHWHTKCNQHTAKLEALKREHTSAQVQQLPCCWLRPCLDEPAPMCNSLQRKSKMAVILPFWVVPTPKLNGFLTWQ